MKFRHVAGMGIGLLLSSAAVAANGKASDSPLIRGILDCQRQTNEAARLRCYDAAAAALAAAAGSGKVVVVDREDVHRTRRALFGFSVPKLPFFSGDDSANDQQDELTAKVASARSLGYDKYQIRLEDGGIWETTEGSSVVNEPRKGDSVTIRRGPLGSYMMRIAGQRGLRAKRVG